jgi:MtN3 and saliva related transmembrane protein
MEFTSATIIGMIGASLTTFAFLPQAIKTIRTKNTRDLSLFMFLLSGTGVIMWLIYGILINDLPIIFANVITFFLISTIIVLKIKYK